MVGANSNSHRGNPPRAVLRKKEGKWPFCGTRKKGESMWSGRAHGIGRR
jgi:hypothetical protein